MDDAKKGGNAVLTIDLEAQTISRPDGETVTFHELDPFRKHCLVNGLEDIGLTEQKTTDIAAYEQKARTAPAAVAVRHDPNRGIIASSIASLDPAIHERGRRCEEHAWIGTNIARADGMER